MLSFIVFLLIIGDVTASLAYGNNQANRDEDSQVDWHNTGSDPEWRWENRPKQALPPLTKPANVQIPWQGMLDAAHEVVFNDQDSPDLESQHKRDDDKKNDEYERRERRDEEEEKKMREDLAKAKRKSDSLKIIPSLIVSAIIVIVCYFVN